MFRVLGIYNFDQFIKGSTFTLIPRGTSIPDHYRVEANLSRRHGLILNATFSRFWAQFALEDFCCPVPKLNRLFMVGSCFTGHAIQLFWHMSACYQIILRIFFHKISQTILVIQEFQIILVVTLVMTLNDHLKMCLLSFSSTKSCLHFLFFSLDRPLTKNHIRNTKC